MVFRRTVASLLVVSSLLVVAPTHAAFPPGFLWGTANSGFQSEAGGLPDNGDPGSDWWVWTHDPSNVANGIVSGDLPERGPGFWDRYPGDVKLAQKRLRNNAFRFGIEWSRIFPVSTAGIDISGGLTPAVLQRSTFDGQERVTVTAGAINRGPAIQSLPLTLEVDGRAIQSKTVALTEGGSASVTFDPFTPASKFTRGTVRVPNDQLAADNAFHFVVTPRDRIKVVLAGRAAGWCVGGIVGLGSGVGRRGPPGRG